MKICHVCVVCLEAIIRHNVTLLWGDFPHVYLQSSVFMVIVSTADLHIYTYYQHTSLSLKRRFTFFLHIVIYAVSLKLHHFQTPGFFKKYTFVNICVLFQNRFEMPFSFVCLFSIKKFPKTTQRNCRIETYYTSKEYFEN